MSLNKKGLAPFIILALLIVGIGIALYLVQNPQIFSPKADSRTGFAFMAVNSNPCTLTQAGTCTVQVDWAADPNRFSNISIRIKETGGLFAQAYSGSQAAPWITSAGVTFQMYNGNTLITEAYAKGLTAAEKAEGMSNNKVFTVFTASPNPCNLNNNIECTSNISWTTFGGGGPMGRYQDPIQVTIKEAPGSNFSTSPTASQAAPWIRASGATFEAYVTDYAGTRTLTGRLFVRGTNSTTSSPSPSASPSLNPSPSPSPSSSPASQPSPSSNIVNADINNDGTVDILDLNQFISDYPSRNLRSDVDHDGDLDIFDVNLLIANLGSNQGVSTACFSNDQCPANYSCQQVQCIQSPCQMQCVANPAISDKLSSRLQILARAYLNGTLPTSKEAIGEMLSLAPDGPGSLSRMEDGRIVAELRLQDTSSAVQSALVNAGAEILSVSPQYRSITIAISISRLTDLGNIPALEYAGEVIRPSTN